MPGAKRGQKPARSESSSRSYGAPACTPARRRTATVLLRTCRVAGYRRRVSSPPGLLSAATELEGASRLHTAAACGTTTYDDVLARLRAAAVTGRRDERGVPRARRGERAVASVTTRSQPPL